MSKLKIRVHESNVSRIRNQDAYYQWILDSLDKSGPEYLDIERLGIRGGIDDSEGNVNPYISLYIDEPDRAYYDDQEFKDKFKEATDYIRKEIPNIPGLMKYSDYFDIDLADGGLLNVAVVLVPKDALWDEDIEDIKYVATKALEALHGACTGNGPISEETLLEKGLRAPNLKK